MIPAIPWGSWGVWWESIFGERIPSYFAALCCAFVFCTWFAVRWAKRIRLDHDVLIDLSLISVITGVAGARIAHVLFDGYLMDYVHMCTDYTQVGWQVTRGYCESDLVQGVWDEAAQVCHPSGPDCFAWAKFWQGGLTWYGGMFLAVGYAMYFLRKEGFPQLKALDLAGNVLPLGLFFGRMGCFFGGCCFGQPTDHWIGVVFPEWSPASEQQWRHHLLEEPSLPSLPVLPAQLFEGFGSLLIALFAIGYLHPRKRFDGHTFCISMTLYAVLRFGLEALRDDQRGGLLALSTSQWIGIVIVVGVAFFWRWASQRAERERAALLAKQAPPASGEDAPAAA